MATKHTQKQATTKFDAVIFDRDGVLVDFDIPGASCFLKKLLPIDVFELGQRWDGWGQQVGFPQTLEEEKTFFHGFWEHLSAELGLPDAIRRKLSDIDYTDYLIPYPDARTALTYARSQGLKIGVLSNFGLASLQMSLDAVGFGSLVDVAISASVSRVAKPDPQAYLGMASALGVHVERSLFFDDEVDFVRGALDVGMTAYLVDRCNKHTGWDGPAVADLSTVDALIHQEDKSLTL